MGTEITTIKHTGPDDQDLTVKQIGSKSKGLMLQLTQGLGGLTEPGYIQLSMGDARLLVEAIEGWLYGFEMQEDDK